MRGTIVKRIKRAIYGDYSSRPETRKYRWDRSLVSVGLRQAYKQAKRLYKQGLWNPVVKN